MAARNRTAQHTKRGVSGIGFMMQCVSVYGIALPCLQPVTWLSFGFVVLAGGLIVLYVRSIKREKERCE